MVQRGAVKLSMKQEKTIKISKAQDKQCWGESRALIRIFCNNKIGSDIHGINLAKLTNAQKEALWVLLGEKDQTVRCCCFGAALRSACPKLKGP